MEYFCQIVRAITIDFRENWLRRRHCAVQQPHIVNLKKIDPPGQKNLQVPGQAVPVQVGGPDAVDMEKVGELLEQLSPSASADAVGAMSSGEKLVNEVGSYF